MKQTPHSVKVTCITPCNRPDELPALIDVFLKQDYRNKELVIATDALYAQDMDGIINAGHRGVLFVQVEGKNSIGALRNAAIQYCYGEIIIHFDSDDWYAPDYITRCVDHLYGNDITGLSAAYFSDGRRAWLYNYTGPQPYVIGSGMAYWKRVWSANKFKDISNGEDMAFCAKAGRLMPLDYIDGFVARIHGNNTASHKMLSVMKPVSLDVLPPGHK